MSSSFDKFDTNHHNPPLFLYFLLSAGAMLCVFVSCVYCSYRQRQDDPVADPPPVQIIQGGSENIYPNHVSDSQAVYVTIDATPAADNIPTAIVVCAEPSAPPTETSMS